MIPSSLLPLANHLWQSTAFAALVWLLTLALRRNSAPVRYGLWLAASVKFLIPFSVLVSAARQFGWRAVRAPAVEPYSLALERIRQPFTSPDVVPLALGPDPVRSVVPAVLIAVWICGVAICAAVWFRQWRRVGAALRGGTRLPLGLPIPVVSSATCLEPGVVGLFKPTLLLPDGIAHRLAPAQLQAILDHELCHVRRHDNFAAAIHMLVESIFWFHPLVWWIGGRLVEERERACDEEVVRMGNQPDVYAEGILAVCRHYLESPLACASGVTGSDLKRRIESIVNYRASRRLTLLRKLLLAVAGMAAVGGPVIVGVINAPLIRAQGKVRAASFEVTSVKPSGLDTSQVSLNFSAGGTVRVSNMTLKQLIASAYNMTCGEGGCSERISGGPAWIDSARWEVQGKGPESAQTVPAPELRLRLQALLADRFQLVVRREMREKPVYHLVVAKDGLKFRENTTEGQGVIRRSRGELTAERAPLHWLVANLTGMAGRPVIDKTSLTGRYDFRLEFTPELAGAREFSGPPIFTALQEQLGLRLEAARGPVEFIIIERAEKPSED